MSPEVLIHILLFAGSAFLTIQAVITLIWMLYAWENPRKFKSRKSPKKYLDPLYSFSALVPMRHEEKVALDTIRAISEIDYPNHLKEIVIICRNDDTETINKAQSIVADLGQEDNTVVVLVNSFPINKPYSLNQGLRHAKNHIITIFDAEDEPHPDIYRIVNTVLVKEKVDIVQSGVQLMNYDSRWYSPFAIMEYFLWFKSGLSFFTDWGDVAFLGGNTVFFKKNMLKLVGGWDENTLTEDADIGIRLTLSGAKAKVIYDPVHVTREEAPGSVESYIKQRTRWNQGFLQILAKGDWKKLPTLKQKFVTLYVLLAPFLPIVLFLYIPFGIWTSIVMQVPVSLAIFSYTPFYLLFAIVTVQILGLWEFTKIYRQRFKWYLPLRIFLGFFAYTAVLAFSAIRAIYRVILNLNVWEKTLHLNAHREV
jgi:glycosyltransferase XagB